MRTCYSSILSPWNSRAITRMRTQCVPGPLPRGRGLGTRLVCQILCCSVRFAQYLLKYLRFASWLFCVLCKLRQVVQQHPGPHVISFRLHPYRLVSHPNLHEHPFRRRETLSQTGVMFSSLSQSILSSQSIHSHDVGVVPCGFPVPVTTCVSPNNSASSGVSVPQ